MQPGRRPGLTSLLKVLRAPEHQFFDISLDMFALVGRDGLVQLVNRAWTRVLGYDASEAQNRAFVRFVHPEDVASLLTVLRTIRYEDWNRHLRFRMLRRGGGDVWVDLRATAFNGEGRSYIVLRDVSDDQAEREALERQQRSFEKLLEESPVATAKVDRSGVILYQTPASLDLLGYEPAEMVGRNAFDFAHPDEVKYLRAVFDGLAGTPGSRRVSRMRWRHASGQWIQLQMRARNLLDDPDVCALVVKYWTEGSPFDGGR